MTPDPDEGAVLQDLKELGLDGEIEAADLIEEEGPVVRLLDASEFCGHCAGKCAFFVAEELGFEQGVWNGWAAYFDERTAGTQGVSVKEADANLFSGSAFALNEDGNIGLGNAFELVPDSLHGCSLAENNLKRRQIKRGGGFGVVDQGHFFLSFRALPQLCNAIHTASGEPFSYDI